MPAPPQATRLPGNPRSGNPCHDGETNLDTLVCGKPGAMSKLDACNGYWGIPMRLGHEYRAGLSAPNGMYWSLTMPQGPENAVQTYAQFGDIVFGFLPPSLPDGNDSRIGSRVVSPGRMPHIYQHGGEVSLYPGMDVPLGRYISRVDIIREQHHGLHAKIRPVQNRGPRCAMICFVEFRETVPELVRCF